MLRQTLLFICCGLLMSCGFHFQGQVNLAPPLQRMYLQTADPYSDFARSLRLYLKNSHVKLVEPSDAETILTILQQNTTQDLLGVSGTQQTKQYLLRTIVVFQISNKMGRILVPPEMLVESRVITVQSNLILGASNEVNLYFKQMRRTLAYALMNRIASRDITRMLTAPVES